MHSYRSVLIARAALLSFLVIGGLSSDATPLKADIVFSNLVGNCCGGDAVNGTGFGSESLAEAFIAPVNYLMSDAQVEVFQVLGFGGDPNFNVSLFSDAGGLPGSLIATIGADLTAPAGGGLVTASGPMPVLASGTPYWLVLTPFDSGTEVGWEEGGNPLLVPASTTSSTGQGGWMSTMVPVGLQFQVDGTPTPEPASLIMVATVLVLMALLRLSIGRRAQRLGAAAAALTARATGRRWFIRCSHEDGVAADSGAPTEVIEGRHAGGNAVARTA